MASSISPLTASSGSQTATTSNSGSSDPVSNLANEQTFLQLLVAQIENQNPLNPTDSVQFVTQLAQFSEVEQMVAVRQDTDTISQYLTGPQGQSTTAAQG